MRSAPHAKDTKPFSINTQNTDWTYYPRAIPMTPKKLDRLVTAIVILLVAALMVGFVILVIMYNDGSMDEEGMLMTSTFLSSTMFVVVIVYGVFSFKIREKSDREKKLEEFQKRDKEQP